MNFTREPIIETVITPREGMKLLVRCSKGGGQEEYLVDAVEVVSFGRSLFFRSLERPKSFLVPVSDYEVIEFKEMRVSLKNAAPERSIKIGGGRAREQLPEEREAPSDNTLERSERPAERSQDRKRDKRRRGRRGGSRHESSSQEIRESAPMEEAIIQEQNPMPPVEGYAEEQKTPSFISKLFPPPPTLIKETLSRYKPAEPLPAEGDALPEITEHRAQDEDLFDTPASPESESTLDNEEGEAEE